MISTVAARRVITRVTSAGPAPPHPAIHAGSLDSPLPGSVTPGRGVEINGWVIPNPGFALASVFAVVSGNRGAEHRLTVARPDVAADYPELESPNCGFSFWCPLTDDQNTRIQLVGTLASGVEVPLLYLDVSIECELDVTAPGMRFVDGPDFAIIGTQRGGTTSLHAYLNTHPDILTPAKKEIHYLTDRHARGVDWYIGQFPSHVPAGTLVGEATPYALFHPLAPQRLREVAPSAKIVVLLRNPVDRAYSHYLHERNRGHEDLSFEDALAAEPERLRGLEEQLASGELLASDTHKRASYLARGRYAVQLERWLAVFPREQMLILRSEDLYDNPAEATRRVTGFLDLPPLTFEGFTPHNATSGPPIAIETRKQLARQFASENARLADLLGWNSSWT